jgi:ABC-2 type transport system permease protein
MYWSVRRELWENRSVYLAPLIAAGIYVAGLLIGLLHLSREMRAALASSPELQHDKLAQPYDVATSLIMGITLIVSIFYSLDALYSERRDRSILFWKSLPVSDLTAVLSKAIIVFGILPLLIFLSIAVTHWITLLLSSAVAAADGMSVATLWTQVQLFQMDLMLLYHIVTVHILWYAPLYGWLLLVSAWAKRAPFLWAFLPMLAIGGLEKLLFNTMYFATMLQNRVSGGAEAMPMSNPGRFPVDAGMHITPVHYVSSPGLWIGLALTALFLAAAVRLRRARGPL